MPPLTYWRRRQTTPQGPAPRRPDPGVTEAERHPRPRYESDSIVVNTRRCDAERLLNDGILTEPMRSALRYALEVVR